MDVPLVPAMSRQSAIFDAGVDPNNGRDKLAISMAARFNHCDVVKLLLERGALNRNEALHAQKEKMKRLLYFSNKEQGAKDDRGSALGTAVDYGHTASARVLLQHLNYEAAVKRQTLQSSSSGTDRFRLLDLPSEITHRIGVLCTDYRLALPSVAPNRRWTAIFSRPPAIVARALLNYPTLEHALVGESSHGNVSVLAILCQYAHVSAEVGFSPHRTSALTKAASAGHLAAVKTLLDAGADARRDISATRRAIERDHSEVVSGGTGEGG
ncbi:hypothetical protein M427DRAFT_73418 [Gonapodya prolifera JEL478]|uniref:Ankyrin n=1 Tax=Gonapodya prolifera (strain JEL478) TaxID=1344416 RepID=A0A139A3A2_GONPJ|nr:hypothetical protein M427DRAFT_73418 [Gonapodya prolifera JEL478]|eukprot:KXS10965.1 hypothetical protein M427DRAFT_73418 [Gonapodya prolifera JEL478]